MPRTHADVARDLAARMPPGVFAHAARNAVLHQDFAILIHLMPGVFFNANQVSTDEWQLSGTCADGSTVIWQVGG